MKKLALIASLLLAPVSAFADNSYSGVWQLSAGDINGFISVHIKDGWMITADLDVNEGDWSAMEGPIVGNKATLNSIYTNSAHASYEVTFTSATEAFIVVKSCTPLPGYICLVPNGSAFPVTKIF